MMDYSEAELKLIRSFKNEIPGQTSDYHISQYTSYSVYKLYSDLSLTCFLLDLKGPNVEALRKATMAVMNRTVPRSTKKFDKLCSF
jgi:hypothetical protein